MYPARRSKAVARWRWGAGDHGFRFPSDGRARRQVCIEIIVLTNCLSINT